MQPSISRTDIHRIQQEIAHTRNKYVLFGCYGFVTSRISNCVLHCLVPRLNYAKEFDLPTNNADFLVVNSYFTLLMRFDSFQSHINAGDKLAGIIVPDCV